MMLWREAGGADHDRRAGGDRGIEMPGQRIGRGEVDQHVGGTGERCGVGMVTMHTAVAIDPAGDASAEPGDDVGDGLPHPPAHAENADRAHRPAHPKLTKLPPTERKIAPGPDEAGGGSAKLIEIVMPFQILHGNRPFQLPRSRASIERSLGGTSPSSTCQNPATAAGPAST